MTFNYRAGLFRIWLVISIFWVGGTALGELPLGLIVGVPLGLGLSLYAIVWAVRGFGVKQHPPVGFFDLNQLRLDLALFKAKSPDSYKTQLEPLLDLLQAQYGNHVPNYEMEKLQQINSANRERLAQQMKEVIDREAAEGKTIQTEAIRQNIEKNKAAHQGQDRDAYAEELDRLVDTLMAKYGDSIPVDEAYAIVRKLEADLEVAREGES